MDIKEDTDKQFIKSKIVSWADLQDEEITLEKLVGGFSRAVFKVVCTKKDIKPNAIIMKKYNETHTAAHKENDHYFAELMDKAGVGVKYYGSNDAAILEEFVDSRVIQADEVNSPVMRRKLAIRLAKIHKTSVTDPKIPKTNWIEEMMDNVILGMFRKKCEEKITDEEESKFLDEIRYLLNEDEINLMKRIMAEQPILLGHNDMWSGNILIKNDTSDPVFIDFERMHYNFVGFDIGKLFNEPVFVRPNPPSPYYELKRENAPTEEDMKDLITYYLLSYHTDVTAENENDLIKDTEKVNTMLTTVFGSEENKNENIEKWLKWAKGGVLVSAHLLTTFGVSVGKNFNKELDFHQLAVHEHDNYKIYKKKLGIA
jgi:thiamine kinase-like enzyme